MAKRMVVDWVKWQQGQWWRRGISWMIQQRHSSFLCGREFIGQRVESPKLSIQKQIINALQIGQRDRASDLLLNLSLGNSSLSGKDFVGILKYCAKSTDPLFAMETWRLMEEKEIGLTKKCYQLIIRTLCKGGYLDEAFNLINYIGESHGNYLGLPAYNGFLGACSKMQSIVHANLCLDLMERRMVGKSEDTYIQLLKLAVGQQNLSAVHQIWKDYIKYYTPSILCLQKFIRSFTMLKDFESAYKTLQQMVSLVLSGNTFVKETAYGKLYSSRLDIPIPLSCEIGLQKFELKEEEHSFPKEESLYTSNIKQSSILHMENSEIKSVETDVLGKQDSIPTMKILKSSFNNLLYLCAQTQNCRVAEQLMLQMQKLGVKPSSNTYDGFIRAIVHKRGLREGIEELKTMQQRNLKPHDSTLAVLSICCSKVLDLDSAESLLNQISKCPYPYPYNAFLLACTILDQPERAVQILAKMKQLKVQPNFRTYEMLFSLFGTVNAPFEEANMLSQVDTAKRIHAIEMDMAKNGVQHSPLSMRNLLKALGEEGMIRELIQYLHSAEEVLCRSNASIGTLIYNTVLHALVEAKESDLAIEMFKNMKSGAFLPNAATYTIMIDCCSIIGSYKSACALLSLMMRHGFCPQTPTYSALIKVLLQDGNFSEALNLLYRGNKEDIKPDVLLYNTILQTACGKGRIDVIELIVEQMYREKVQPDPTTCHYVFSAYVECGFHNTAMEAVQVLSMRMISLEGKNLQEKEAKYLEDLILSEDLDAETRILEFFGDYRENIAAALLNLRWCAIIGFPILWSPNEALWARRLSSNYNNARKIFS